MSIFKRKNYQKLLATDTRTGEFGRVEIKTYQTDLYLDERTANRQEVERFSYDDKDSLEIEFEITSSMDDNTEIISFHPRIKVDDMVWETGMIFKRNVGSAGCYFRGYIGMYGGQGRINGSMYERAKALAIELCDPNRKYEFRELSDLLGGCQEPNINKLPAIWGHFAEVEQSHNKFK